MRCIIFRFRSSIRAAIAWRQGARYPDLRDFSSTGHSLSAGYGAPNVVTGPRLASLAFTGVAIVLLLMLLTSAWAADVPGKIEGKLEVDQGQAKYTIRILTPPGVNGMAPSLAIRYASSSANGVLGVGWKLSGLQSITRCRKTIAQDDRSDAVALSFGDAFCMNGQRLVLAGRLGAESEYRTEIDQFSRIVQKGTSGQGPAWFEVWTKDGLRLEFGRTPDSALLAGDDDPTIRKWTLNRVEDVYGNSTVSACPS